MISKRREGYWPNRRYALSVSVLIAGMGISPCGCRAPLDTVQLMLERHNRALEKLPDDTRAQLMPYGSAVTTEQATELIPPGPLSLESARAVAIRANPDIHAAQARLAAAREAIAEARAQFLPTAFMSHSSTRTFQVPASRNRLSTLLQPQPSLPTDIQLDSFAATTLLNAIRLPLLGQTEVKGDSNSFSENSTAFTISWTLFDGFVREANLLAAKMMHKASWASLGDVERLIVQAVDTAYYQVQLAQEQIRIAKADEEFSEDQLNETEKLRAAGRATSADVNNFRVRMLAARANVTAAMGLRDTGLVALAELMGLPGALPPDDLEMPLLAEETEAEMTTPDAQPWIARALENRPDLQQLRHMLEADEERVRVVQGRFMPTMALTGSWGFDRGSNLEYDRDDQSSAVVFEFRWDLFTGGARRARLHQAESRRAETAATVNRLRLSIQSEIRQAIFDLRDAQEQIRLQRENVIVAKDNRRVVQAGYLAGKETLNRLNEAQRDYLTADADLILARIRLRQAWSDLNAAAGTYRETVDGSGAEPAPHVQETSSRPDAIE